MDKPEVKNLDAEAVKALAPEALTAALADAREQMAGLLSTEAPTVEQVQEAKALAASIRTLEAEQKRRDEIVAQATQDFAALRAEFSEGGGDGDGDAGDGGGEGGGEGGGTPAAEAATETEGGEPEGTETTDEAEGGEPEVETTEDETKDETEGDGPEAEKEETVTASAADAVGRARVNARSAAREVGRKAARPAVPDSKAVTITAAAETGFDAGAKIEGTSGIVAALQHRAANLPKFSAQRAKALRERGITEQIQKYSVAQIHLDLPDSLVSTRPETDFSILRAAARQYESMDVVTASTWCAPSETIYSWLASYEIDGLVTVPEIGVTRGGIRYPVAPTRKSPSDVGWDITEEEAEEGYTKPFETLECLEFVEKRLDATGYGIKVPFLLEKGYPEIVEDAFRITPVLFAHRRNTKIINEMVSESTAVNVAGAGSSFNDTLEALAIVAQKERARFFLGENAVMEVKAPRWVRDVLRFDLARRRRENVDAITNQAIDAHFQALNLNVEYVLDWQDLTGDNPTLPGTFDVLIYPAGTFVVAQEPVVNLSAVYDAASLAENEYLGVFYEQGILVAKMGYRSLKVTIPVCNMGQVGAAALTCIDGSL